MCGISGYFFYSRHDGAEQKNLDEMTDVLVHRGPDARGTYLSNRVGLGHRRLSIIDISERANQPMKAPDADVRIVYNGETYNFREIKKELQDKGYRFDTTSDTEVILNSYLEWGEKCLERFRGIFAFAIWDTQNKKLFMARDRFGIKPLFYADLDGVLVFASEIKSILKYPGFPSDPDYCGLDSYFTYGYVPAPDTGFKKIKQLMPGEYMMVDSSGIRKGIYWQQDLGAEKLRGDDRELAAEFDRIFATSVKRQMVSDVPIGAFLSGGNDSFAVVKAMSEFDKEKVHAFTIGFREKSYNELDDAKKSTEYLNVRLEYDFWDEDYDSLLPLVRAHCAEPFADASSMPVYILSELTAKSCKVALSGDGADEMLGGYFTYNAGYHAQTYRKIPSWIRRPLIGTAVKLVPETGRRYSLRQKLERFYYAAEKGPCRDHALWRYFVTDDVKKKIYSPDFYKEVKDHDPVAPYAQKVADALDAGCSLLDAMLYADFTFYLPNDMLVKVDRMSMANSLEVRVPFLDRELVEFTWRLPERLKINKGITKYMMKGPSAYSHPAGNIKKRGFGPPIYRKSFLDYATSELASALGRGDTLISGLFRDGAKAEFRKNPFLLYACFNAVAPGVV